MLGCDGVVTDVYSREPLADYLGERSPMRCTASWRSIGREANDRMGGVVLPDSPLAGEERS